MLLLSKSNWLVDIMMSRSRLEKCFLYITCWKNQLIDMTGCVQVQLWRLYSYMHIGIFCVFPSSVVFLTISWITEQANFNMMLLLSKSNWLVDIMMSRSRLEKCFLYITCWKINWLTWLDAFRFSHGNCTVICILVFSASFHHLSFS